MPSLMSSGDPPAARCTHCGEPAVGPCARCRRPTCANCCELTEGGATTFAICLACVKRGGRSLAGGYRDLLRWLAVGIIGLAALAALVAVIRR